MTVTDPGGTTDPAERAEAAHTPAAAGAYYASINFWGKGKHNRLGGPEAWLIWVLATIFVVWLFSIQTGYGIVSQDIQIDAELTLGQVSLAAAIYTWVFAVVQFFSGALLDRYGLRPLMTVAVILVTVGAFLYAATSNFATLAVAQVVLAVGSSFGFVGAGYVGGKWFDGAKYGLMFGLVQMCAAAGSAVAQPAIQGFLGVMSWRNLLYGFGSLGVLLVIAFAVFVRNPDTPEGRRATDHDRNVFVSILSDLAKCFANLNVVVSALFAGASFGVLLAVGVVWGPRVGEAQGASPGMAALLVAMAWAGLAVGSPVFNLVSNMWHSRKWPSFLGMALQLVSLCLFIYDPWHSQAAALIFMFGIGFFSGAHMLGFTVSGESVTPNLIGSAAAIVNGVCFIIGGVLAAAPGWLLPDEPVIEDYQSGLLLMPIVLGVGTLLSLFLRETVPAVTHD